MTATAEPQGSTTAGSARYAGEWALFLDWCAATGRTALPADPPAVEAFLLACPAAPTTLARRLTGIDHHHTRAGLAPPARTEQIRDLARGRPARPVRQVLDPAGVDAALRALPIVGWTAGWFGRRDRALIVLAAAGIPYRRIAQLTAADLELTDRAVTVTAAGGDGDGQVTITAGDDEPVDWQGVCAGQVGANPEPGRHHQHQDRPRGAPAPETPSRRAAPHLRPARTGRPARRGVAAATTDRPTRIHPPGPAHTIDPPVGFPARPGHDRRPLRSPQDPPAATRPRSRQIKPPQIRLRRRPPRTAWSSTSGASINAPPTATASPNWAAPWTRSTPESLRSRLGPRNWWTVPGAGDD